MNNKISARYALSLLDITEDTDSIDTVTEDARTIVAALDSSVQLRKLLVNPVIKTKLKASVLDEIFTGKVSEDTLKFIRFILDKNREEYLYGIMRKFLDLRNEKLGIVDVQVVTVVEFNDKQEKELIRKLESVLDKKVQMRFVIDTNIIGGFIAKVGDTLYDASVKNQLVNLKRQLLQGNTV